MPLTFDELSKCNLERCEQSYHPVDDWSPSDWLTCVMGEVGELAHLFKDERRGDYVSKRAIARELADIVIYLDLLAQRLSVNLGDAVVEKFNITSRNIGSDVRLEDVQEAYDGADTPD